MTFTLLTIYNRDTRNGGYGMIISHREFEIKGLRYTIRSAREEDAKELSALRLQVDGETENMDREKGEAFLDEADFANIIRTDTEHRRNLFLVAAVQDEIVGFSRCQGSDLTRFAHKVEFGVGVLQAYWGHRIGGNLLQESIVWADSNDITKMALHVLETNEKAIRLYKKLGFDIEGVLKNDKRLSDGTYYNTIAMGRIKKVPAHQGEGL
jgi:RimJ/RimL family protein N-acetyltransferase